MAEETMTQFVDNPYTYLRSAQLYQREGDVNGADIAFKAAIMAADKLPLHEYSRDFQREVAKYRGNPGYQTQPGITLGDLTESYADTLSLPFRARLLFSHFLMNNGAWDEAETILRNALEIGIDASVANAPLCMDLRERAEELLMENQKRRTKARTAQNAAKKSTQDGLSTVLGKPRATGQSMIQTSGKQATPGPLPVIEEMWQTHMEAQKKARASVVAAQPQTSQNEDAPLSCDMKQLVDSMYACLLAFSKTIESMPKFRGMKISITEPSRVQEHLVRKQSDGRQSTETVVFYRFRASTVLWSLSIRATDSLVEIFAVPAAEVMRLSEIEHDNCLRATYKLRQVTDKTCWTMEGMPVYADDVRVNLRGLLKEMINGSLDFVKMDIDARTSVVGGGGILKRITELSQQRTNLAEKIVYQQEHLQKKIARDLHDTVIGDLYAMKRSMEAEKVDAKYIGWIDHAVGTLRGICADLAPRDLEDWGLRTVLRDMVSGITARSGIHGEVEYDDEIPELAHEVQLQIYRIIQECLINIEKHSKAQSFTVKAEMREHIMMLSITDNGVGFNPAAPDSRTAKVGGMGLDGMKERVQLIRCFYPAQIWINSNPGTGTRTTLQINTAGG